MRKIYILVLFFVFVINSGFAGSEAENAKGKIKGIVLEEKTKTPLEYATISLYTAGDNKLVTGTITDHLGHFKLELPAPGDYYLVISFIGLKDIKSDVFHVENPDHNIQLGNFYLSTDSKILKEVEVISKQAPIEFKTDRKVIRVDKQLTAIGGTAIDVLENVPSIQVDVEGNVTLRGSSGFTVLIDGKPTILEPSDVLRQIPAGSIQNIEIITNPSVKYEPDGTTGIINIITKKNRLDGLSGNINLNAGNFGRYGGDLLLNYRVKKFNFFVGGNYNTRPRPGTMESERETYRNDTSFFVNLHGDQGRSFNNYGIRGGIEFNATKKDYISLSGKYGNWKMLRDATLRYDEWNSFENERFSYNSMDNTKVGGLYYNITGVYQHTFGKKKDQNNGKENPRAGHKPKGARMQVKKIEHKLEAEAIYQYRYNDEYTINELVNLSDTLIGGKKNVESGPSAILRLRLDYTLPVGKKDKFEAGFQSRNGKSTDITGLYLYDAETGEIEFVPEFYRETDYRRDIYAVYSLYAGEIKKFGYQAGLRVEYTDRNISMSGEDDFIFNRWDFFPTLHLSYQLPYDQQLMTSYSRRIQRSRGWQLEPFITWQDAYNVRKGNPDLKPEYTDSYELSYLKKFKDNFFSLEGYYRVTHNKVERVSSVYTETVMLHTFENVGNDYSLGVEVMLNLGITKWWDVDVSGNFYNYKLKGTLYDQPFERTSANWNTRVNNTFRLWKNGQFQLSGRYNSSSITAQGTSSDYYSLN
ncbi:MAG: TonB-dependent receptor, partial [Chlorobi bacterium]|nr:TonB-dependent receptor [Chlorobiota bacterium]